MGSVVIVPLDIEEVTAREFIAHVLQNPFLAIVLEAGKTHVYANGLDAEDRMAILADIEDGLRTLKVGQQQRERMDNGRTEP